MLTKEEKIRICKSLAALLGEEYTTKTVLKNAGTEEIGILNEKEAVAPIIYIDHILSVFESFEKKKVESLEDIDMMKLSKAFKCLELHAIPDALNAENFKEMLRSYNSCKEFLFIDIIDKRLNQERINEIVTKPFAGNLYLCVRACLLTETGQLSTVITKEFFSSWEGASEAELFDAAFKNSLEKRPLTFNRDFPGMIVVTNSEQINGASAIAYPDALSLIEKEAGGSFYILPSSVHEVIIIQKEMVDSIYAKRMVYEANTDPCIVEAKDVLSYSVFYYDSQEKTLTDLGSYKDIKS